MRKLIVTGDDFGLAVPVNEAIEEAHRRGILTTASLMVGAGAVTDAVERARRLPTLKVGRDYGLTAVRVPYEPLLPSWRASGTAFFSRAASWLFLRPWSKLLQARLRRAGVRSNDYVVGLHDSGQMDVDLVLRMLRHLPHGVTEMYFHPATRRCPEIDRTTPTYRHEREFEALVSPAVREAIAAAGFQRVAFSEL